MNSPISAACHQALVKAATSATTLANDLQALHRQACEDDPILALLVRDLIGQVRAVQTRLAEIEVVGR
jgi:hypothetical protein